MAPINSLFNLKVGLEEVRYPDAGGVSGERLPEAAPLLPTEQLLESRLDKMLYTPTLDASILESLRPSALDRGMLSPDRYAALLGEARAALAELASQSGDLAIAEVVALLETDQQDKALLAMYRHLLHQG